MLWGTWEPGTATVVARKYEQVQVLTGDWRLLLARGPFDLLVLDGGGNGKTLDDERVEPQKALRAGGSIVRIVRTWNR